MERSYLINAAEHYYRNFFLHFNVINTTKQAFSSWLILDMVCRYYLSLFLLDINIKIDKNRC